MRIVEQSWHWLQQPLSPLETIEQAGRTCYKSEDKICSGSAEKFGQMILKLGHESVIEHVSASVRFITNRGVTHEIVRHRMCSFSQESTRYVKYSKEVCFIKPVWWDSSSYQEERKQLWIRSMEQAEIFYQQALAMGDKAEEARDLLPNALKTELVVTANLREWRHIFAMRCARSAHPQIRALMVDCLRGFASAMPVLFDDLAKSFLN